MTSRMILAIDQGTSNTKVMLVDESGSTSMQASRPVASQYPQPAWVEQDPLALISSVREAIELCMQSSPKREITAVAITNQRESVILWERASGKPLGPCIGWQCRRTAPYCSELRASGLERLLHERTGLTIDPLFSASKARWLLEHAADGRRRAERGELCLGTVDSWILWHLTGGQVHASDATNASRTQLFNIHRLHWDEELLEIFGIPSQALPEVKASSAIFGETAPAGPLPGGLPIAALIGDSHAALFGQAGFAPGAVKATYGTGSSLMMTNRSLIHSHRGLSTTIAWLRERVTYALEGNISATGSAVQWLAQLLGAELSAEDIEGLARGVPDPDGVYFVPAFVGLGAPHWNPKARGLVTGLTHGTTAAHLARAVIEAIAYQVRDVFDVMEVESGTRIQELLADGGAAQNDQLMQFQADIIGRPVSRNVSGDVSALGAAYLAGLATGLWSSTDDIEKLARSTDRFEPHLAESARAELYAGWQQAVARTMFEPGAPGGDKRVPS